MNLYVTADQVGKADHGAGAVTFNESEALRSLGPCEVYGQGKGIICRTSDPWGWDEDLLMKHPWFNKEGVPKHAHFYAGTFSKTIEYLKRLNTKVSYTAAAHSIEASRKAHEELGLPYDYPHLNDPELWKRYVAGYLAADVLIVPSTHSANVMRSFGATNRIEVIPHGIDVPEENQLRPPPKRFVVGYLGNISPDKGIVDLLKAWKRLNYKDATLMIGGRDSASPFCRQIVREFGGGNILLVGWQKNLADFYGAISLYVQPSRTEGFGIEVLEAMSYGRPVIASTGAGACDAVLPTCWFDSGNVDELARVIDEFGELDLKMMGDYNREESKEYSWSKIRQRYGAVWKELMA